jgi:hypothetical protein
MKVSLLGAVALWIFARSVFAMSSVPAAVAPTHAVQDTGAAVSTKN